ncbi:MAG: alkaline phosphatase D family protein [bacterium]
MVNFKKSRLVFTSIGLFILLFSEEPILSQSDQGYPRLMQGSMLGAVTENSIKIWVRTSGPFPVSIVYGTDRNLQNSQETEPMRTEKSNDYVAVIPVKGLVPETRYFYKIKVNGVDDKYLGRYSPFEFKTAPLPRAKTNFRIAIGSCARYQYDRTQPIWRAVALTAPDLFFWLGDNIYGDALDPDILREEYRRQRDVQSLQPLLRTIPQLAIWDDHDFGLNDHDVTNPVKEEALQVFKQYWANPSYGLPEVPAVFFRYSYGAVDFFFLDVRYHRDPNRQADSTGKTMLGKPQLLWLKSELKNSRAIFKVLISGSGWSTAKGPGGDSWASFLYERNAIFDFIRDNNITGVVLLSGDTHVGELNVIPWSAHGGYDFYELVSSPLAQPPADSWIARRPERRIRPVYFVSSNFGIIDFIFDDSAKLIFQLKDDVGRNVWQPFELKAQELVNGVQSWPDKVDPLENIRHEKYEKGEGYYEHNE